MALALAGGGGIVLLVKRSPAVRNHQRLELTRPEAPAAPAR
jgi:hypothetical protein